MVAAAVPLPAFASLMVTVPFVIPAVTALPVVAAITVGSTALTDEDTTGNAATAFALADVRVTEVAVEAPVLKPVNVPL